MGRNKRIKTNGPQAGYHLVTRVHKRQFLFNDHMKRFFVNTLQSLNYLFEVEIGAWAILGNHLHLLCRFADPRTVDPDSTIYRWNQYHPKTYQKNRSVEEHREYVPRALTDVSFFMKKLKTLITREYNRVNNTVGTLWERRFRSSIVERGRAMLMTAAYIELNSFRASLVARPENYEYSSLYWLKKGNPGDMIATDILDESFHVDVDMGISDKVKRNISKPRNKKVREKYIKALYEKYLKYVYKRGTRPPNRKLIRGKTDSIRITEQMQEQLDGKLGTDDMKDQGLTLEKGAGFCRRMWSFTKGKFIGSRSFANAFYVDHVDPGYVKAERSNRHMSKWLHGMSGGVWGVFNGSRRGREEKEWEEQRDQSREDQNEQAQVNNQKEEKEKWIEGGGQRGSPPT